MYLGHKSFKVSKFIIKLKLLTESNLIKSGPDIRFMENKKHYRYGSFPENSIIVVGT